MDEDSSASCDHDEDSNDFSNLGPLWTPMNTAQKWSPQSLHDKNCRSAFQPYNKHVDKQCITATVLTNLQRGNTQTETVVAEIAEIDFYTKAGQGELTEKDIIENERHIDRLDHNGFTALHWSCAYGQYNSVEFLIKQGQLLSYDDGTYFGKRADVNRLGPDEESPLILAANGGHHEIVKMLLQHKADVNHMDHLCNTALMYAAKGNHTRTCQELLTYEADFSLLNFNDDNALTIAMENNSTAAQAVIENYIIAKLENIKPMDVVYPPN